MPSTHTPTPESLHTWMEIIALLIEAADRGAQQAFHDPAVHSTSVGTDFVAASALALLPRELDRSLDELVLPETTDRLDMAGLIRAAELASRRHPIEQLPAGASGVIVGLCELVGQVGGP